MELMPDQLVYLGEVKLPPEPGSALERFHGKTLAMRGIFVRDHIPRPVGALFGVVLPLILILAAAIKFRRTLRS